MSQINILDIDVRNLFLHNSVTEILEVEKSLNVEIKKKRTELRSIVGDKYKDILIATEAIKSIELISECIVKDMQNILEKCDGLIQNAGSQVVIRKHIDNELSYSARNILIQVRLAIELNENIYMALDNEEFCLASQFYLLAQHIHTGLRLMGKDFTEKYRVISKLKAIVDLLRENILSGCLTKLKHVELSIEDTSSLLNAIMLLENHASTDLLNKFISIRKNALETVISDSYSSVRMQIAAMVKCIYTTMQLLHDCFFNYKETNEGLIWKDLNEIIQRESPPTLSKLNLPSDNMMAYIPQIIREFRPKCSNVTSKLARAEALQQIQRLLEDISISVGQGLSKHLVLVPNINGLHLIREEAMKAEIPYSWDTISRELELPRNFDVWYNFFQDIITQRVQYLITEKINNCTQTLCEQISTELTLAKNITNSMDNDLRSYIWQHDSNGDNRKVLSMKTKGFSPMIVKLCEEFDGNYLNLLKDMSLYLYGKEYLVEEDLYGRIPNHLSDSNRKKFVDRECLELHLKQECSQSITVLISYLKKEIGNGGTIVTQSVICARFLTALSFLCTCFNKCCCCNHSRDEWDKITSALNNAALGFWENWIADSNRKVQALLSDSFPTADLRKMLTILCKWDTIEIQEQTDETVFKSQIKIPMKFSMALERILDCLTEMLNALFPHTMPKQVHLKFMEVNISSILKQYEKLADQLNQTQALQFLFDVKFVTTLCVPRENMTLVQFSQDVCDKLRAFVDPFDLDVFYKYLQHNVRQSALQSQVIYGCLLPSSNQLASLGVLEKNKEHEKDPSILAISSPSNNNWFMLLPVSAPTVKTNNAASIHIDTKVISKERPKKSHESSVRSGAAALFGVMTNDWFS